MPVYEPPHIKHRIDLLEAAIDPAAHGPVLSTGTNLNLLEFKREIPLLTLIPLPLCHLLTRRGDNRVRRHSTCMEPIPWLLTELFLQRFHLSPQRLLKISIRISSHVDERGDKRLLEVRKAEAIGHLSNFVCQLVGERSAVVGLELVLPITAIESSLMLVWIIEEVFAVEARGTVLDRAVQALEVVCRSDHQKTVVVVETVDLSWVSHYQC
jgi:hypothetical protein